MFQNGDTMKKKTVKERQSKHGKFPNRDRVEKKGSRTETVRGQNILKTDTG